MKNIRERCADEIEKLVGERPVNFHISRRDGYYMVKVQWDETDIAIYDIELAPKIYEQTAPYAGGGDVTIEDKML